MSFASDNIENIYLNFDIFMMKLKARDRINTITVKNKRIEILSDELTTRKKATNFF
jgi:hypothetical protein